MRNMFPQYDDVVESDFTDAWHDAIFVFDTNVLLDLYRYQENTKEELLSVLGQISERVWIPYQVALEFQRNRKKVMLDQDKRFIDVERVVMKAKEDLVSDLGNLDLEKRHSVIDPKPLLDGFDRIVSEFVSSLRSLRKEQRNRSRPDSIKERLEKLFDGKVGSPPQSQEAIDRLYETAEVRYKAKLPPGYRDEVKGKKKVDDGEHLDGCITYKRKYGDFLMWDQTLSYAKSISARALIFVTNDQSDDWWRIIESNGPKTIGPRPELIEEARRLGGLSTFLMYTPERFLGFANTMLKIKVSETALTEIREVAIQKYSSHASLNDTQALRGRVEEATRDWVGTHFGEITYSTSGYPSMIVEREDRIYGFRLIYDQNATRALRKIKESVDRAIFEMTKRNLYEFNLIWILESSRQVEVALQLLERIPFNVGSQNVRLTLGVCQNSLFQNPEFVPFKEIVLATSMEVESRSYE